MYFFQSSRTNLFPLLLGGLLIGTSACGTGPTETPTRRDLIQVPGPLALTLSAPAEVRRGQIVPLRLVLTNTGSDSISVVLRGVPGQQADFVLTTPNGNEVWSKLHGATFLDVAAAPRPIAPGDSIAFTTSWKQTDNRGDLVATGTYQIQGFVEEYVLIPGGAASTGGWLQSGTVILTIR